MPSSNSTFASALSNLANLATWTNLEALAALAILTLSGCGSAGNTAPEGPVIRQAVGTPPAFYSSAFSATAIDSNYILATDEKSLTLNEFTLEPFARSRSMPLPFDTLSQQVISDDQRKWFIVVSGADYAVMREDGTHVINPLEVQGQVAGIAVDGASDTVVVSDTFGSMALLQLSPGGEVLDSWISGPMLKNGAIIQSAVMVSGGRLVAALANSSGDASAGETKVVVADISQTIRSKAWNMREFIVKGIETISWMAATKTAGSTVLVRGSNGIALIDVESETIADHILLDNNQILGVWREKDPHVIAIPNSAGTTTANGAMTGSQQLGFAARLVDIYFASSNTKIDKMSVVTSQGSIENSWLESSSDRITTIGGPSPSEKHGLRYRLSDNLITSTVKLPVEKVQIALAPDFIFVQYESALGFAERWGYGRSQAKVNLSNYGLRSIMGRQ